MNLNKKESRKKRHRSLRKRVSGTPERPRLAVFRSTRHIYAQVIDDLGQKTLVSATDIEETLRGLKAPKKGPCQTGRLGRRQEVPGKGYRQGRIRQGWIQISWARIGPR